MGFESILRDADNYTIADSLDSAEAAVDYCGRHSVDLVLMDVLTLMGANGLVNAASLYYLRANLLPLLIGAFLSVSAAKTLWRRILHTRCIEKNAFAVKTAAAAALYMVSLLTVINGGYNPFLYFRF